MARVLFVGHERGEGQSEFREQFGSKLFVRFASGPEPALEMLSNSAFQVVITEMQALGVEQGALFLEKLKAVYPESIRLTLCPPSARDAAFAALPNSHQVLPPCDADTLGNIVERAVRLRALLTESLRQKIGYIEKLPSLPAVYQELMNAMANPDISSRKIAQILEKDSAMAAKILQLVNSACFGISRRMTQLEEAVSYLGMELIKSLALSAHIFSALGPRALNCGFSFEAQQEHALLTARVARRFFRFPQKAQDAFTAGLLHDIGNLVLAVCIPDEFRGVVQTYIVTERPQYEVEIEMLGVTHAEVGAYLLGMWGLPYQIVEAVAFHHNPSAALESKFDIPTGVSVANSLVNQVLTYKPADFRGHLESLGVSTQLEAWTAIAIEEVGRVRQQVLSAATN